MTGRRWTIFGGLFASAALLCACGAPEVTPLDGGGPSLATYMAKIRPYELSVPPGAPAGVLNCFPCHAGGAGGFLFDPNETNPAVLEVYRTRHVCRARVDSYGPPSGKLFSYFCDSPTQPNATGHEGRTMDAAMCTNVWNWLAEGEGTQPGDCP